MSSRDAVLGRVRAALADVPADETPDDVPVPRNYRRSHTAPGDDLVTLFAERVADYRATVHRTDEAGLTGAVAAALAARAVRHLAVPSGFPETSLPSGPWTWHREPLDVPALDALDGAVTLAAAGIAVTGTLVLDTGPGQGRRALTLVPDHHLCVVYAGQVAADVPDALTRLDPARPLTFVSGPSATSDIELDRVEGDLGYEEQGINIERGFVITDEFLRTSVDGVYAVGDLISIGGAPHLQLAHVGFAEGILVAEHIAGLPVVPIDYAGVPRITYSSPEVASVGLSEKQAAEKHGADAIKTVTYDLSGNGRSAILNTKGAVKLVALQDGTVLGIHIVGDRVGELIAEAQLIYNWEALASEVAQLIHPHPTQSEAIGEAHLLLAGKPLHVHD